MKETTLMLFGTAVFSLVSDKFNPRLVFAFEYIINSKILLCFSGNHQTALEFSVQNACMSWQSRTNTNWTTRLVWLSDPVQVSHILPTAKAIELLFNFDVVRYFVSERNNRVQTTELTVKRQLPNERCWKLYWIQISNCFLYLF